MYMIILVLHNPDLLKELMEAWDKEVDGAPFSSAWAWESFLKNRGCATTFH